MHDDDRQTGRILTRREALALLGTAGAALLAARVGDLIAAQEFSPDRLAPGSFTSE